ncbi:head scaffolding protein [Erwinia phage Era103]|uniref:Scaffolding-like protein n=1 Tax=Erwinia phage Era103 TaxID=418443 RepID=A2I804_9CAUD|nr:head scaffolding protein [Erwinia phage Era103]ABM63426.1 scaffolding-like protein [Erwinia phage Era103]
MFQSLFKSIFNVRYMAEENPDAPGAGGEAPTTEQSSPDSTGSGDQSTGDEGKLSGNESSPDEQPDTGEPVELFYGDSSVSIDIPEDISSELSSKGLDAQQLANELYRKDGEFSLTKETREKLDGIYGKFAVDAYLNSLKVQNDAFLKGNEDAKVAMEQANTERFTAMAELVGGEEGWNALTTWGNENLSDQEIDDLNAVMQSGNESLQRYAIQMLANQRRQAEGDPEAVLIQGQAPQEREGGPLSAQAYRDAEQEARKTFRGNQAGYQQAIAKLDARRRSGMQKGL